MNQIKRVIATDADGNWASVTRVKLMNKQGRELGIYDPYPYGDIDKIQGKEHQLADNEDLIGVYGVMDKNDSFSAFGFIVRVREE